MELKLRCNYKESNDELKQVEEKNQSADAFCFNCEKGFSVNDGGYFIVDEPYCSLECVIEAIIKEINSELMIKKMDRNHYNLDSTQKERIIEFTKEKGAIYLVEFLEKVLYDD